MRVGLDVGSTTIKCVVLDDRNNLIYHTYERHYSHIVEKSAELLRRVAERCGREAVFAISGSAGMGMAESVKAPFVQEVFATRVAANRLAPGTDVIIELGGEDAKILFLTNGMEVRMNGSCAGGTGAFIDQMATLLKMGAEEMDKAAQTAEKTYTIAARCGVFAKSDIQPLINQGAKSADIAKSIYQAVVNQTIAGLAQGRPIKGHVLYLGGPLTFSKCLRQSFDETLGVTGTCPENSLLFVALGAAFYAEESWDLLKTAELLEQRGMSETYRSQPPLFENEAEYDAFKARHAKAAVPQADFPTDYAKPVHIGIDSGSTTVKVAVIDENAELLFTDYRPNQGDPIALLKTVLLGLYESHPKLNVASVTTTGYGEDLAKAAFHADFGVVETVAHFTAAKHFMPDVDFIIDIGGQDIKCFKIKNHTIDSIMLNEACSSGCGSFIQSFAQAMGYDIAEFSQLGLFARNPVDLGSRCTVFMNSSVKQAQKDGATVEDISAGLSASIIKNAIYKVIRAKSVEELGQNIVVQGGTFLNDAVLRSFEQELGRNVIRPAISGLMGAFGAALYAMEHQKAESTLISPEALAQFSYTTRAATCKGCTAHCSLSIVRFSDGHTYISGNRCEKGAGKAKGTSLPSMMTIKYDRILHTNDPKPAHPKARVGLPMALSFYEQMPFWHAFFNALGFETVRSEESDRNVYYKGQHTIASDTICYPAKLTHGHIESLLEQKVDFIFYPCMSYNIDEGENDNHYNCPVVAYYPELLKANNPKLNKQNFQFPYMDLNQPKNVARVMQETLADYGITRKQTKAATEAAFAAQKQYREWVIAEGQRVIAQARAAGKPIIVLAGRPYHIDPEINHGIHKLITSLDMAVVTEDCVAHLGHVQDLQILNQWTYHARLYRAAEYVTTQPDMQLVQLVSLSLIHI